MRLKVGWFMHGLAGHWLRCSGWCCVRQGPRAMSDQAERICDTGAQSIERMAGLHRRNTGSGKPQAGP